MTGKKILILGSGMVAKPCKLADGRSRVTAVSLDVASTEVESAIAQHDLVISLVPFIYHADVARLAIQNQTQVVTTSYVSPAIKELDGPAKAAGITILNEVGVDPGVDHCYAVKVIGEVHAKGGKVREFYSYCGGLPAPEASNNPLKFKLSWSPRGALLSQYNAAIFLKDGAVVEIPNDQVMASAVPYHVMDGYSFLAYPNRNSVPFREFYQIPEARTVVRGSLRYDGNPQLIQQKVTAASSTSESDLLAKVDELCHFQNCEEREAVISGLRWVGLFSEKQAPVKGNLLDTLSAHLDEVCKFQPNERDLVMLQHKFVVDWPNGKTDTITSTMELLGEPGGYSGMSKSVGITCGVATQMLLDGHPAIAKPGVVAPYNRDICDALREKFEPEGIKLVEKTL
ncbi:hypothetical protein DL767_005152 [Monosporascus sp. MG133]|nr:hypothetical protein DL767_005152 [Monosporascus sp. MG133]